jgi:hypothetical protein
MTVLSKLLKRKTAEDRAVYIQFIFSAFYYVHIISSILFLVIYGLKKIMKECKPRLY